MVATLIFPGVQRIGRQRYRSARISMELKEERRDKVVQIVGQEVGTSSHISIPT